MSWQLSWNEFGPESCDTSLAKLPWEFWWAGVGHLPAGDRGCAEAGSSDHSGGLGSSLLGSVPSDLPLFGEFLRLPVSEDALSPGLPFFLFGTVRLGINDQCRRGGAHGPAAMGSVLKRMPAPLSFFQPRLPSKTGVGHKKTLKITEWWSQKRQKDRASTVLSFFLLLLRCWTCLPPSH